MLGPGGEHAVGFAGALGDEVIDQDGHVGLIAAQEKRRTAGKRQTGVQRRPQALGGGLLVAGGAVYLAGQIQSRQGLGFQGRGELDRIGVVVFDGVARAHDDRVFQARDGGDHGFLGFDGQAGGDAVGVDLRAFQAFGLQEHMMAVAFGKPGHLVLHRRAVARAGPLDDAGKKGRPLETGPDGLVGAGVGVGEVAGHLGQDRPGAVEAEARGRRVPGLGHGHGKVDALGQKTRGGAGLEAAKGQPMTAQAGGQAVGRRIAQAAAAQLGQADVDKPAQKGAGGDNDGPGGKRLARGDAQAADAPGLGQDVLGAVLAHGKILLGEHVALHHPHVLVAVDLGAGGAHGRPFAGIERAELDAGGVGPQAHPAAERVDLADHVPLGQSADGRIAGQVADAVHVLGEKQGLVAQSGGGHGRLAAGVSGPDHDDVERHGSSAPPAWKTKMSGRCPDAPPGGIIPPGPPCKGGRW